MVDSFPTTSMNYIIKFCVTKIKYIMYIMFKLIAFFIIILSPIILEGWHFTDMWKALASMTASFQVGRFGPMELV